MSVSINGSAGLTFNDGSTQATAASGFGFKNRIINGAMVIDQRNAGASVTPSADGSYQIDRWQSTFTVGSKFSVQQSSTAPTGFKNSTLLTSTSAYSVTGSDRLGWQQQIEGLNVSDLAWGTASAAPVTISFWVRSSLTGTMGGSIANSGNTRAYPFSFTINAADTWEYKTITVAGDQSGTWLTTNGIGLNLRFCLGAVASYRNTAGSWVAGDFWGPTGGVNLVGTNGATFYITGVQLEKGSTATSFDYRPYGTELALCQRYYQKYPDCIISGGYAASGTTTYSLHFLPVELRTSPTWSLSNFVNSSAGNATINFASSKLVRFAVVTSVTGPYFSTFAAETTGTEL
jgi:hypothetical protein